MSSLIVSNLSDGTLSIPTTYVTNGSAKAWVNFSGIDTIAARDSLNLSSLTDNGLGDFTVSLTNAFDNTNYASSGFGGNDNINGTVWITSPPNLARTSWKQTGLTRIGVSFQNTLLTDVADINLLHYGDLA